MDLAVPAVFAGGFACVWCGVIALALIVGIGGTVLWIWALVDCLTKETDQANNRLIWTLVIIFTHAIGALIYLLIRRPERQRELGK